MASDGPLLLALDTTTRCSTVALTRGTLENGQVLACLSLSSDITHSRRLICGVDQLFRDTGTQWSDVAGIAIGLGPGSFTGLRIGVATAKGFATAVNLPLIGVSTLDGLAASCTSSHLICATIDARKKQVYTGFYRLEAAGKMSRKGNLRVLSPEDLTKEIDEPVLIVGDGVDSYGALWKEKLGELVQFAPSHLHLPMASTIGLLCGDKLERGDVLDVSSAVPIYVRASDAELSLSLKKQKRQR